MLGTLRNLWWHGHRRNWRCRCDYKRHRPPRDLLVHRRHSNMRMGLPGCESKGGECSTLADHSFNKWNHRLDHLVGGKTKKEGQREGVKGEAFLERFTLINFSYLRTTCGGFRAPWCGTLGRWRTARACVCLSRHGALESSWRTTCGSSRGA